MMTEKLIIFGTSKFALDVTYYIENDTAYTIEAYTNKEEVLQKENLTHFNGKPVVPFEGVQDIYSPSDYLMFVAVGYVRMNHIRHAILQQARAKNYRFMSYICSSSSKWGDLILGENVFIFDQNILQPRVLIQDGVILSRGNSIGHDSILEESCFLANRVVLCGYNTIQKLAFIGSNATIADHVTVAPRTLVGAGAFIKRDTEEADVFITPETPKISRKSSSFFAW